MAVYTDDRSTFIVTIDVFRWADGRKIHSRLVHRIHAKKARIEATIQDGIKNLPSTTKVEYSVVPLKVTTTEAITRYFKLNALAFRTGDSPPPPVSEEARDEH